VEHEEHRVQPLFGGLAEPRVHELVFGHEQARNAGHGDVSHQVSLSWSQAEREPVAREHTQRIDGVPDALPAWQAAPAMKVQLVDQHGERLEEDRSEHPRHHAATLRSTAPDSVRPGPNARLTTS